MRLSTSPFGLLPRGTRALIIGSFAGYVLGLFFGRALNVYFGLVPVLVTHKLWLWQPFTYMFLHGSFLHLFFNLFMLWMFGSVLEGLWGTARFLRFYGVCGLGAAALHLLLNFNSPVPVIGASGAVYGLLAAFALEFPTAVVYVYFLLPLKARTLAIALAVIEFAASFSHTSRIANLAHLGGLITGVIYLKSAPRLALWRLRLPSRNSAPAPDCGVDGILEKIRREGEQSLSGRERAELDACARRFRGEP